LLLRLLRCSPFNAFQHDLQSLSMRLILLVAMFDMCRQITLREIRAPTGRYATDENGAARALFNALDRIVAARTILICLARLTGACEAENVLARDHASIVNYWLGALFTRVKHLSRLRLANEVDLDITIVNDEPLAHFVF